MSHGNQKMGEKFGTNDSEKYQNNLDLGWANDRIKVRHLLNISKTIMIHNAHSDI